MRYNRTHETLAGWNRGRYPGFARASLFAIAGLLALAPTPALAVCARIGSTANHSCPSTGDAAADGQNLATYLQNRTFACGDTIILQAGATYQVPKVSGFIYPPRLYPQTGCVGRKQTQIVSSRLHEMSTEVVRTPAIALADYNAGKYAILSVPDGTAQEVACGFSLYGAAVNNWYVGGILIATSAATSAAGIGCVAVTNPSSITINTKMGDMARNITFDRIFTTTHERLTYGDPSTHADINQYFSAWKFGFAFDGVNVELAHNTIDQHGFDAGYIVDASITAATAASPVVLTSTGITAAYGIANPGSACSSGCNLTCWDAGGCRLAAIGGATGEWSDLNGLKALVYDSADSVRVYKANSAFQLFPEPFDGTGRSTLAGTVGAKRAMIGDLDPMYNVVVGGGSLDYRILSNYLGSTSGMNIFLGGGSTQATNFRATIQSGSTDTVLNLSNTAGLAVGDLLGGIPSNGSPSIYCPVASGKGCASSTPRVCKVTAINGNAVTVIPWGPSGLDFAPAGGNVVWNGNALEGFQIRGNLFDRPPLYPITGKGMIELKSCVRCLIDGNRFRNGGQGNAFLTSRNQGGNTPWNRGESLVFSNNLYGSEYDSTLGTPFRGVISGLDDEMSSAPSKFLLWRNNVVPQVKYSSGIENFNAGSFFDGGFEHNTLIPHSQNQSHYGWQSGGGCATDSTGYWNQASRFMRARSNITLYGNNNWLDQCPFTNNSGSTISGNLLIASVPASQSVATINGRHAGNTALSVVDVEAELAGACENATWKNCRLKSDSIYRGTAADGGDPGADVEEVEDRLNRWSERAGLLIPDIQTAFPAMVNNPGAWQVGSTSAAVRFDLFASEPGSCTVELFTVRNRSTRHADASVAQACNRTGSMSKGNTVEYVFGTVAALTASTMYWYRITDGVRVMVGEFRTLAAGGGKSFRWSAAMQCGTDGATFGTSVNAGVDYSVPAGAVRYCRESGGRTQVLVAN